MTSKSGYIVQTKDEKIGRTFHDRAFVNKKVPVYLATEFEETILPDGKTLKTPVKFSENGTLCEPTSLKVIGFL